MARSAEPVRLGYVCVEPEGCLEDKSPIIFLHGVTVSKDIWGDIPKVVADATKRKVYNVDARNHGDSEWSNEFNFPGNVDDLLHFMDTKDIQRAVIVGQSLGGITGMDAAIRVPNRIDKIIVVDMGLEKIPPEALQAVQLFLHLGQLFILHLPSSSDEKSAATYISNLVHESLPLEMQTATTPESLADAFQVKRAAEGTFEFKNNLEVLEETMTIWQEEDRKEPSGTFEGPACFIYGKNSPFKVGDQIERIQKFYTKSEFVGIEGAGHAVHSDRPKEFLQALLTCLQKE